MVVSCSAGVPSATSYSGGARRLTPFGQQRQRRAGRGRAPGVIREARGHLRAGQRAGSPTGRGDQLGEQFGAHAVACAGDRVDAEPHPSPSHRRQRAAAGSVADAAARARLVVPAGVLRRRPQRAADQLGHSVRVPARPASARPAGSASRAGRAPGPGRRGRPGRPWRRRARAGRTRTARTARRPRSARYLTTRAVSASRQDDVGKRDHHARAERPAGRPQRRVGHRQPPRRLGRQPGAEVAADEQRLQLLGGAARPHHHLTDRGAQLDLVDARDGRPRRSP